MMNLFGRGSRRLLNRRRVRLSLFRRLIQRQPLEGAEQLLHGLAPRRGRRDAAAPPQGWALRRPRPPQHPLEVNVARRPTFRG